MINVIRKIFILGILLCCFNTLFAQKAVTKKMPVAKDSTVKKTSAKVVVSDSKNSTATYNKKAASNYKYKYSRAEDEENDDLDDDDDEDREDDD